MKTLSASVGAWEKAAVNHHADVVTVQELLQTAAVKRNRPDFDPGAVDGKIARAPMLSTTLKAIKAFQQTFMPTPDGLIESNKTTLRKLNEIADSGIPNVTPPPAAAVVADPLVFPLAFVPKLSYKTGGRRYGADRAKGTRKHAGCDLIVPEGTPIYAVDNGTIVHGPYYFYRGTYAVEVQHPHFIARYCEIKQVAAALNRGSQVRKGQVIAYVGKMYFSSMLHFEMYQGTATGPLTQRNMPPYQRRSDHLDPTPYLDAWSAHLPTGS
jgi:murein DD-endopeptidase MepM/ murein hydrolase activator NlpD